MKREHKQGDVWYLEVLGHVVILTDEFYDDMYMTNAVIILWADGVISDANHDAIGFPTDKFVE